MSRITRRRRDEGERLAGTPQTRAAGSAESGQILIGFELDADRLVTRWTGGAEAALGWAAADVLGAPAPVELPEAILRAAEEPPADALLSANAVWTASDGARLHVAISATRVHDASGVTLGIVARDISAANQVQQQLQAYALDLRESYGRELQRLEELQVTYRATVEALATAVEAKDDTTGGHIRRVLALGLLLARRHLGERAAANPQLEYGFLLHDVGKLAVPDAVLNKPGALDETEWALMRRHPMEGARILGGIPFLGEAIDIVAAHHERWDGHGYPLGIAGEEIPIGARLFAIVDTVDAMTSDRPYRAGLPLDVALEEVARESGRQFDPACVESFLALDRGCVSTLLEPPKEH